MTIRIGKHEAGPGHPVFVIAECGVNHMDADDPMGAAAHMIAEIARCGAHAVKFQAYKAARLAVAASPTYFSQRGAVATTQREFFARYDAFGPTEFQHLARLAQRAGLEFLCTPFDAEAVEYLTPLVPAWKIASADITNHELLTLVARTGKPVILSTGASDLPEIREAVSLLQEHGTTELALLHCQLCYPTPPDMAQLGAIKTLAARFPWCVPGYSDHTMPDPDMLTCAVAAALGAKIIEKHYTWDRSRDGNDHSHAMDAQHLGVLMRQLERLETLCRGSSFLDRPDTLARSMARRSLVTVADLPAGHVLSAGDMALKRPGTGFPPSAKAQLLGRTLAAPLDADTIIQGWHLVPLD